MPQKRYQRRRKAPAGNLGSERQSHVLYYRRFRRGRLKQCKTSSLSHVVSSDSLFSSSSLVPPEVAYSRKRDSRKTIVHLGPEGPLIVVLSQPCENDTRGCSALAFPKTLTKNVIVSILPSQNGTRISSAETLQNAEPRNKFENNPHGNQGRRFADSTMFAVSPSTILIQCRGAHTHTSCINLSISLPRCLHGNSEE